MSSSKHTAGQWCVVTWRAGGARFYNVATDKGKGYKKTIAEMRGTSLEEMHYNAKLMAKAPAMLALLEELSGTDFVPTERIQDIIKQAKGG